MWLRERRRVESWSKTTEEVVNWLNLGQNTYDIISQSNLHVEFGFPTLIL